MKKNRSYELVCIGMIIVALILIIWDFAAENEYKLSDIIVNFGLLFAGLYFYFLSRRKRKREEIVKEKENAKEND